MSTNSPQLLQSVKEELITAILKLVFAFVVVVVLIVSGWSLYDDFYIDREITPIEYQRLLELAENSPIHLKPLFVDITFDQIVTEKEFQRFEQAYKQALLDEANKYFIENK